MAGLPWIKVSVDLPRHPKSVLLAARLEDPKAWTYVVQLWFWMAEYAATGEVTGEDSVLLVARGAGWTGNPDLFCRAMVAVGFLDSNPEGLSIHDWDEWAGAHIEKKAKDAKRQAKRRIVASGSEPSHADVRVTDGGRHAESREDSATQRGERGDGRVEIEAPPPSRMREDGSSDRLAIIAGGAGNETIPATLAALKLLHAAGKAAAAPAKNPATRRRDEALIAEVGIELSAQRILAAWDPARTTLGWYADVIAAKQPKGAPGPGEVRRVCIGEDERGMPVFREVRSP